MTMATLGLALGNILEAECPDFMMFPVNENTTETVKETLHTVRGEKVPRVDHRPRGKCSAYGHRNIEVIYQRGLEADGS